MDITLEPRAEGFLLHVRFTPDEAAQVGAGNRISARLDRPVEMVELLADNRNTHTKLNRVEINVMRE